MLLKFKIVTPNAMSMYTLSVNDNLHKRQLHTFVLLNKYFNFLTKYMVLEFQQSTKCIPSSLNNDESLTLLQRLIEFVSTLNNFNDHLTRIFKNHKAYLIMMLINIVIFPVL